MKGKNDMKYNGGFLQQERNEFLAKVEHSRYKTAELVNGNGFIAITESWTDDFGNGPIGVFAGRFNNQPGFWTENDLKNFCF